jgi:hypothetical protein
MGPKMSPVAVEAILTEFPSDNCQVIGRENSPTQLKGVVPRIAGRRRHGWSDSAGRTAARGARLWPNRVRTDWLHDARNSIWPWIYERVDADLTSGTSVAQHVKRPSRAESQCLALLMKSGGQKGRGSSDTADLLK